VIPDLDLQPDTLLRVPTG